MAENEDAVPEDMTCESDGLGMQGLELSDAERIDRLEARVAQCEDMIQRLIEALKLTNAAVLKQAGESSSILDRSGNGMRRLS